MSIRVPYPSPPHPPPPSPRRPTCKPIRQAALRALKTQLTPLELQEWNARRAEREAAQRVEEEDDARLEQALNEEKAHLAKAKEERAKAVAAMRAAAEVEARRRVQLVQVKQAAAGS